MILQPDVCYAGGITELKIIAGMAEAYYTPLAPHNPQGPCSLAASLQVAASIPNFLIQERGDNEYADLLAKPLPPVENGHRALPTEPGLGITIDENKLMAQVGEPRPVPRHDSTRTMARWWTGRDLVISHRAHSETRHALRDHRVCGCRET